LNLKVRIANILQAKISEIQKRVPLQIRSSGASNSFSATLVDAVEEVTNRRLALDTTNRRLMLDTSKTVYPLVSGSHEAKYPVLSSDELSALMPRINAAIASASEKYGVEENMIRSIIKAESSFQPFSLSTSGAMGLMQLMPGTAEWLSVADPYNIEQNIRGGTQYFRDQLNNFSGNTKLALAAYNTGPNAVRRYGGIPAQAQRYVNRVLEYYQMYNAGKY
jgi:soluble lytic murein transglycosylase-like protein